MFSSEIFLRKFILKIYLRKFIFENLSSKIYLRTFFFRYLSSKIYLRKFIFENLSLRGKWKIKSKKWKYENEKDCISQNRTWAFHYAPHLYMFSDVLAPRPHSMSFYRKNRTWNSTHFLMNFHDDLHPPDPNQCQNCKNFSIPKGGRGLQIFAGLVLGCIDADFCK